MRGSSQRGKSSPRSGLLLLLHISPHLGYQINITSWSQIRAFLSQTPHKTTAFDETLATCGAAGIGALAGSIIGTLVSIGLPEEEAQHYQRELEKGRTIVTVKATSGYHAIAIMRRKRVIDGALLQTAHSRDTLPDRENGEESVE